MFARKAAHLAVMLGVVAALGGPAARPASAGADVCPEPNNELAAACFIGPGGAAPGFLDTADDVDTYRLELGADQMVVATLSALPGDYTLHLRLPDGSTRAEAAEAGTADKVVRADGLTAGTYFLSIASPRGASNPDVPYMVSVAYEASLSITPGSAAGSAPQAAYGFIPGPARNYGLNRADVGEGFAEIAHEEANDGRGLLSVIRATDAYPFPGLNVAVSDSKVGQINLLVLLFPYGSNDELGAAFTSELDSWRGQGLNVEPTVGWGSEQVLSYAAATEGVMGRGIALRHRNALVFLQMTGFERFATWDRVSGLMRVVEQRIWAAAQ